MDKAQALKNILGAFVGNVENFTEVLFEMPEVELSSYVLVTYDRSLAIMEDENRISRLRSLKFAQSHRTMTSAVRRMESWNAHVARTNPDHVKTLTVEVMTYRQALQAAIKANLAHIRTFMDMVPQEA